jgi:hypothetical protein
MARKVDRFVKRGAHCCICRSWPAPVESWVSGRIMLTCRTCAAKPETAARLREIAEVEWSGCGHTKEHMLVNQPNSL